VFVIGAGFTGSEIASACRDRGIAVTVAERADAPLVGALGGVIGAVAAELHRDNGVDLRTGVMVTRLEGDSVGRVRAAHLSDGSVVETDVVVVALGATRNTDWLAGSGLGAGPRGVACDAGCRAFDFRGIVTDDVFVAGDVARSPHPLFGYQFLSLEHWGNAVAQAEVAAHNMISASSDRLPHLWVPAFWSAQFGVNIKSVGVPSMGTEIMVTQGSLAEHRFVGVYGYQGRIIAAVSFDNTRWLEFYERQIERGAPFPVEYATVDRRPEGRKPVPADFPDPSLPTHGPTVTLSGYSPADRRLVFTPARH
jgi:NADPH-dependent 2,4-dienoyl-CoA reductase/sulfur reductase-like enzyme